MKDLLQKTRWRLRWYPFIRFCVGMALMLVGYAITRLPAPLDATMVPFSLLGLWLVLSDRVMSTTDEAYSPRQDAAYSWVAAAHVKLPDSRWPVRGKFRCSPTELNWEPRPRVSGPAVTARAADIVLLETYPSRTGILFGLLKFTTLAATCSDGTVALFDQIVGPSPQGLADRLTAEGYHPVVVATPEP